MGKEGRKAGRGNVVKLDEEFSNVVRCPRAVGASNLEGSDGTQGGKQSFRNSTTQFQRSAWMFPHVWK